MKMQYMVQVWHGIFAMSMTFCLCVRAAGELLCPRRSLLMLLRSVVGSKAHSSPSHLSAALTVTLTVKLSPHLKEHFASYVSCFSDKSKFLLVFYSHGSFLLSVQVPWTNVASVSPCLVFCTWFSCVQGICGLTLSPS